MTRPTPDDLTALSQLLDGELAADQADALAQRLLAEPALARAWASMRALPADLSQLPQPAPPDHLTAAVLAAAPAATVSVPAAPPAAARHWPWLAAAAAALVAIGLANRPDPWTDLSLSGLTLPGGDTTTDGLMVSGRTRLALAETRVEVDGRAAFTLSCPSCDPALEPTMLKSHIAAGAAGVALTVTVYEGHARLFPSDGPPVDLHAGDAHEVDISGDSRDGPRVVRRVVQGDGEGRGATAITARQPSASESDEITRLQAEVDRLELENALIRGSLAAHEGQPTSWPDDLPDALREDAFTQGMRDAVAGVEGVDLLGVDCSEFPCIATLRSAAGDGWEQAALAPVEGWVEGLDGDYGLMAMGRGEDDGENSLMMMSVAVLPAQDGNQDLAPRVSFRAEDSMASHAEDQRESTP